MIGKWVPLVSVCDFQGGSQPPKSEWITEEKEGYIRMLQIRDFTQGNGKKEYVIKKEGMNTCEEDDILIARYGASVGKILTGLKGTYNVALMKTIPDENKLLKKYLYYYLKSTLFQNYIKNVGTRAAQAGFNKNDLKNLKIFLPSLSIQEKIVNVLDKAQLLIDKRKAQIEALDQLTQSVFLEMFGDPVKNEKKWYKTQIGDISELITKGESPKWQGFSYVENGIRFITSENVLMGKLNLTKDKYIPNEFHDKLKRSQLQEDDLLINLVGASIGRCAKIDENALPANINQAVALIRINKSKILPDFLLYQLMNDKIQNQLASSKVEGARANISLKNIKELQIILPDIEIQKKFVGIIKELKQDSLLLQEGLNNLYNLYNSILGKAFNGDIFTEEKVSNF